LQAAAAAVAERRANGAVAKPATDSHEPIKVPLTVVARNWPDPVRSEIVAAHFAASLLIPYTDLEAALKRGRAIFTWKLIRSWLSPKGTSTLSEYDDLTLELPLSVLAPMFVGRLSHSRPAHSAPDVPDVFVARKKEPEPTEPAKTSGAVPAPTAAAPAPAPVPVIRMPSPAPTTTSSDSPVKVPAPVPNPVSAPNPGQKSTLAPKQVVERACGLHGVAGALIATHDGLTVATQLPAGVNGEALGAFLPQIFGRLSQYTRELKFDNPVQLQLLLGTTPLLLIKSNLTFFGVLGKPAELLPQTELAALAHQLAAGTN
jgi:predicted regulator of Ras-like GTPase activity (Roadblock/LC7/MglB family)